jgi:hypothetical protein
VYTLLSPARPDNPVPTSAESVVVDPPRNRSIASSESSYGRVEPSKYTETGFSPPDAIAPDVAEYGQKIFAKSLSSPTQLPADEMGPNTSHQLGEQPDPAQTVREFIDLWNERYFYPRNLEASLVLRHDTSSSGSKFAVNLASRSSHIAHASGERIDDTEPNIRNTAAEISPSIAETTSEQGPSGSFTTAADADTGQDPAI